MAARKKKVSKKAPGKQMISWEEKLAAKAASATGGVTALMTATQ